MSCIPLMAACMKEGGRPNNFPRAIAWSLNSFRVRMRCTACRFSRHTSAAAQGYLPTYVSKHFQGGVARALAHLRFHARLSAVSGASLFKLWLSLVGRWRNDHEHGVGIMYDALERSVLIGEFVQGLPSGSGVKYYSDGSGGHQLLNPSQIFFLSPLPTAVARRSSSKS